MVTFIFVRENSGMEVFKQVPEKGKGQSYEVHIKVMLPGEYILGFYFKFMKN